MAKTVTSLYHSPKVADDIVTRLQQAGVSRSNITIHSGSDTNFADDLDDLGVPWADAQAYTEGVRRGGSLVVVEADDDEVDNVLRILDSQGAMDLDEHQSTWRSEGWTGDQDTAASGARRVVEPGTGATTAGMAGGAAAGMAGGMANHAGDATSRAGQTARSAADSVSETARSAAESARAGLTGRTGTETSRTEQTSRSGAETTRTGLAGRAGMEEGEEVIPIIEEELRVGKREVDHGRVRIHTRIVEHPVEEQVTLRDESVDVERRPGSDRAVTGDAFKERTVEVEEHDEEPVVSKEAHVREELVVRKGVDQRTETIRDTVRRTEVEIEDERDNMQKTGTKGPTERKR
jgi:uncharacterized protein (TIGR02271 family)